MASQKEINEYIKRHEKDFDAWNNGSAYLTLQKLVLFLMLGNIISVLNFLRYVNFTALYSYLPVTVAGILVLSATRIFPEKTLGISCFFVDLICFLFVCGAIHVHFISSVKSTPINAPMLTALVALGPFSFNNSATKVTIRSALFSFASWAVFSVLGGNTLFVYQIFAGSLIGACLALFFLASRKARFYLESKNRDMKEHLQKELEKVAYPHIAASVVSDGVVEKSMPTDPGFGIAISVDVVGSSKNRAESFQKALREFMDEAWRLMSEDYRLMGGDRPTGRAFRVKTMGDGFLCTIGYPLIPGDNKTVPLEKTAIALALSFVEKFHETMRRRGIVSHIAVGIAEGRIQGYFSSCGPKDYELFGEALVFATRVQEFRKEIEYERKSIILCESKVGARGFRSDQEFELVGLSDSPIRDASHIDSLMLIQVDIDDRVVSGTGPLSLSPKSGKLAC
jgi:hypothetical protein